jgi:hypothetical protein
MQFRKPEWLDSAVGVAGLILSMLALLVGSNLSARGAAYGALSFAHAIPSRRSRQRIEPLFLRKQRAPPRRSSLSIPVGEISISEIMWGTPSMKACAFR